MTHNYETREEIDAQLAMHETDALFIALSHIIRKPRNPFAQLADLPDIPTPQPITKKVRKLKIEADNAE